MKHSGLAWILTVALLGLLCLLAMDLMDVINAEACAAPRTPGCRQFGTEGPFAWYNRSKELYVTVTAGVMAACCAGLLSLFKLPPRYGGVAAIAAIVLTVFIGGPIE